MTTDELLELIERDKNKICDLHPLLRALALIKMDRWDDAHELADQYGGTSGDWLHAYLHRVEGDIWNADYWYRRAGRRRPDISLEEEWKDLAQNFTASFG